jgi:hypothetical protein
MPESKDVVETGEQHTTNIYPIVWVKETHSTATKH